MLKEHALAACTAAGAPFPATKEINPILLAYIGDVVFSMYVRLRLLPTSKHVRIVHDIGSKMVSAVCQCQAMQQLEEGLNDEEKVIFRRGRNAKSHAPRSATVAEYHASTGFEALLGSLYLSEQNERLYEIAEASFQIISKAMMQEIRSKK